MTSRRLTLNTISRIFKATHSLALLKIKQFQVAYDFAAQVGAHSLLQVLAMMPWDSGGVLVEH